MVTSKFVVYRSLKQLTDWRGANEKVKPETSSSFTGRNSDSLKCKAPEGNCLKLYVDASLVQGASSFAVGWIFRDRDGEFEGGRVMRFNREVTVLEAESTRILESLSWVLDRFTNKVYSI